MYRVTKPLNHNALLAVKENSTQEYLIMGKGIGFGKKVSERFELSDDSSVYIIQNDDEQTDHKKLINEIEPKYLEVSNTILQAAEKEFGQIAESVCEHLKEYFQVEIPDNELGYLAMHIERVFAEETE